ncbi:MAG: pseudouridine-5'-phosphate glycosidase [Sporichthyaceae bacterium]
MGVDAEVAEALAGGRAVVALESTVVSHGLPRPDNLVLARDLEAIVRAEGAVPATVAVLDGVARIGLDSEALEALATREDVAKLSVRDLAPAVALGRTGATTVSATAHLAAAAGIELFATGGLGGVHRDAAADWDVSADLETLARTPIAIVCSGVKSLLDVPATCQRLETLGVAVLGYRTDRFPGFYLADSGQPVDWRVENPAQAAAVLRARRALLVPSATILANPVPPEAALDPAEHDAALTAALTAAREGGVRGQRLTPFLLARMQAVTGGSALAANVALLRSNARLAARIAVALASRSET